MIYPEKPVICLVGLGYVGLPLAFLFGKAGVETYGFDIKSKRIEELKSGIDSNGELSNEELSLAKITYSADPEIIKLADFIIITAPTPVDKSHRPDLSSVISASETVGRNLKKNSVVVFESTVYPGVTEEICRPVIEKFSDLKCGQDWVIGYSPERINPGDKKHTAESIVKITSGMDAATAEYIDKIYRIIIKAGTFRATSIKVAEAAKVIENTQRDLNVAFINELSKIFNKLNINTFEVLEAAGTKWNFLKFKPGLVGGHCIGVDPYYLLEKAELTGFHPQLISVARRINDGMAAYCASQIVKLLISSCKMVEHSKLLIMGATFKENIKDNRNSKIAELINELKEFRIDIYLYEPNLTFEELGHDFKIEEKYYLKNLDNGDKFDGICYAVGHQKFDEYDLRRFKNLCADKAIFFDIKGKFINSPDISLFNYQSL